MEPPMEFGLDIAQHQLSWDELVDRARFAEEVGFAGVWLFDHFQPLYGDPSGPCLEAWSLLAALAAATDRVRLGALVSGVTYRHASILTAQALTVDHVSAGRLDFAIGAAWHEGEHRQLGIPFPPARERVERLEEAIAVFRALCTTDRASFKGRHYRLDHATLRPRPVQRPHPPVWVGGTREQLMLPLVGRVADVWHTFAALGDLPRKAAIVREHAERAGRDPDAIRRAANLSLSMSGDAVRRTIDRYAEAGFDYLVVSWPGEGRGRVEEFVADVLTGLS
jgi:F420-dependent oxidoreductase-like protein